ncbi:MAG: hypothetical protein QM820_22650 [Minicystis sp.]
MGDVIRRCDVSGGRDVSPARPSVGACGVKREEQRTGQREGGDHEQLGAIG